MSADACTNPNRYVPSGQHSRRPQDIDCRYTQIAAQSDLGVTVDASDRDHLEKQGLIGTLKREQNALWLKLEEAGWAWAQDNLTKALTPGQTVLHNLMVRLDAHLKAKGERLVDVIGTSPKAGPMDPELTGVVDA